MHNFAPIKAHSSDSSPHIKKHKSKRAKPLNLEILYQIFCSLDINKDEDGNYLIEFEDLKENEVSAKYFSATEWQCFRKRIMNHGFDIVDEHQLLWIKARPSIQSADGRIVFDFYDLRTKYSTPCKIKIARDKGELKYISPNNSQQIKMDSSMEEKIELKLRSILPSIAKKLYSDGKTKVIVDDCEISLSLKRNSQS